MIKLTKKEEEILLILWKLKKAYVNDILETYGYNRPHYNTVSTVIRRLEKKGHVGHKRYGSTNRYFPILPLDEMKIHAINDIITKYFDNSADGLMKHLIDKHQTPT